MVSIVVRGLLVVGVQTCALSGCTAGVLVPSVDTNAPSEDNETRTPATRTPATAATPRVLATVEGAGEPRTPTPTASPSSFAAPPPSPSPIASPSPSIPPSPAPSPTVAASPAPCGATPHGGNETRVRYFDAAPPEGSACVAQTQTRACTDGSFSAWNGTAGAEACVETIALPGTFVNDSIGDQARLEWGVPQALAVRLLVSSERAVAEAWRGETAPLPAGTSVATSHSACTGNGRDDAGSVTNAALEAYHHARAGTGEALAASDRCGIDLSGLGAWETRYLRVHVDLPGSKAARSRVVAFARVPRGMVFVAKEDWPDEGHPPAGKFDFALDKFTASHANGTLDWGGTYPSNSSTLVLGSERGKEATLLPWSAAKTGCENRNASVPATFLGSGAPERVHLATDLEWFVGAFGTPLARNGACYSKDPSTNLDDPLTGAPSRKGCLSRYGAWEMTNTFENVDAVVVANPPVDGIVSLTKSVFGSTPAEATTSHTMPAGSDDGYQWGGFVSGFDPLAILPTSFGMAGTASFGDATFRLRTSATQRVLAFSSRYWVAGYNRVNDATQGDYSAFARCAIRKP